MPPDAHDTTARDVACRVALSPEDATAAARLAVSEGRKHNDPMTSPWLRRAAVLASGDGERSRDLVAIVAERLGATTASAVGDVLYPFVRSDPEFGHVLAVMWTLAGQPRRAVEVLQDVLKVRPLFPEALNTLGNVFINLMRESAGHAAFRRAIAGAPALAGAQGNLGLALLNRGLRQQALPHLARATAISPAETAFGSSLGRALSELGQISLASRSYRRVLAWRPQEAAVINNLATLTLSEGSPAQAERLLRRCLAVDPYNAGVHSNLLACMTYRPETIPTRLYREARRWEAIHAAQLYERMPVFHNARDTERRLRIGYLSADFLNHPVAWNMVRVFEHHDRSKIATYAYAHVAKQDDMSRRIACVMESWRSTTELADSEVAKLIRSDGIDILVLLAGHLGENRPLVLAHRPAPVQVSMFDIATTGMSVVNAWMTDPVLHPSDTEDVFVERLMRLPSLYLHSSPAQSQDPSPLLALERGFVTFGSFNNLAKISDFTVALWAKILGALPSSRLVLGYQDRFGDAIVRESWAGRFAAAGVLPQRIDFLRDARSRHDHLARVAQIDIVLDTFPFNGSTSSFEALWQGVPVVTLAGRLFVSRCGAATLSHVGLSELVASTGDDYVAKAVALAGNLDRLQAIRSSLRQRVLKSRLCDAAAYTRALEEAYRELWRDWCARHPAPRA
jgi:predicted O-linked N-acetylglucosamine transferase (SPINDLY family)